MLERENRYEVVTARVLDTLENKVNEKMKEGWEPLGGVAVCVESDYDSYYLQAMIKPLR